MRARSASRGIAAVAGLLVVLVVVPAVLVATSSARFGRASPLHGMDPPWRWTLDGARSWWHRVTDQLDTSAELVDLFVRVALLLAWVCVAVVLATVVAEVVYQLRHGMPSSGRRNVLGLAWVGRVVAGGLVALLPLTAAAPALADGSSTRAAAAGGAAPAGQPATAAGDGAAVRLPGAAGTGEHVAQDTAPPGPDWTTYVVQRGDSVWSIAGAIAGGSGDTAAVAAQIVEVNRGATMPDGHRFTTPALIEPGWHLAVPSGAAGAVAVAVATAVPVGQAEQHVVVAGDSYWRIAADDLVGEDGSAPAPAEILARTQALIDLNAPRLGHDDPHLLLPGETVELLRGAPAAPPAATDVTPPPEPAIAPRGADGAEPGAAVAPVPDAEPGTAVAPVPDAVPGAAVAPADAVPPPPSPEPAPAVVSEAEPAGTPAVASSAPAPDLAPPPAMAVPPAVAPPANTGSLPSSSADPARTAPPTAIVADATTDRGSNMPVGLGLGGSVLFATGAVALLEARRRQRLRAATLGQRMPAAALAEVDTERGLRAIAAPERVARLDVALRIAAPPIAAQRARIVAVEVLGTGEMRLATDTPVAPSGGPWALDVDGWTWLLPASWSLEDLAGLARRAVAPCPALAHVGSTERGQLYVDLEAAGLLAVDLPEPMATDVVRCIAASVALSPLADGVQIVTVGLPGQLFDTAAASVEQAATLDAALELAAASLGSTRAMALGTSTFALRSEGIGVEGWEPAIVIAADGAGDAVEAAQRVVGDGLAVVVAERVETAGWRIERQHERIVLEPLGVPITPCGLSVGALTDVHALLQTAQTPFEVRPRLVGLPSSTPVDVVAEHTTVDPVDEHTTVDPVDEHTADIEPPWSLLVRVFGQVEVVGADGTVATFERSKALELVVWLTQHRRRPTRTVARTALWDVGVRDATFANVVSDARRAMARAVAPPPGSEWLARTLTEELPLHDEVITDADLVTARLARARGCPPPEAVEVLRPAVELLTGMPFAGTVYLWPDAEGISSALVLLGVAAALQMARLSLDLDELEDVFWATGQGLQVLAGHEELIALRMQAHAAAGDLAGVRHEWASYERAIDADPWSAAAPSPKLVALRHRLLSAPGVAAGS